MGFPPNAVNKMPWSRCTQPDALPDLKVHAVTVLDTVWSGDAKPGPELQPGFHRNRETQKYVLSEVRGRLLDFVSPLSERTMNEAHPLCTGTPQALSISKAKEATLHCRGWRINSSAFEDHTVSVATAELGHCSNSSQR